MNIAYFGSPAIAATVLKKLVSLRDNTIKIALVVTQPDRPAGKQLNLQKTKVKEFAESRNLRIFDKDITVNSKQLIETLKSENIELGIVYAFGAYLPVNILHILNYGFVNIHFSLLPKYRGASPITYPLILGDKETGVTLIQINKDLDGGDTISQKKIEIFEHENRIALEKRLTELSIPMILEYITEIAKGKKTPLIKQEIKAVSYTRLIKRIDGYISLIALKKALNNENFTEAEIPGLIREYNHKYPQFNTLEHNQNSGLLIYNYYRGLYGWPGIWTTIPTLKGEKRLKLTHITCSQNKLNIQRVQLEGKNEVSFSSFNEAYKIF